MKLDQETDVYLRRLLVWKVGQNSGGLLCCSAYLLSQVLKV